MSAAAVMGVAAETETEARDYQSLFWVPMLYQTSEDALGLIDNMLEDITAFYNSETLRDGEGGFSTRGSYLSLSAGDRNGASSGGGGGGAGGGDGPVGPRKRRQQILGDDSLGNEVVATRVEVITKSEDTTFAILSTLKKHFLFSQLHDYELEDVIDSMQDQFVSADDIIIQEGDAGDKFYVLTEGLCEISIAGEIVGQMDSQGSFGDLSLMYNCPRAATIRALTDATLWTLDRPFFRQAMVTSSSNQGSQLSNFLSKLKLFESLGMETLSQVARSVTVRPYEEGQYIITQGEIGDQFFVIYKGTVRITKTGDDGKEFFLVSLKVGDVFGERALIRKEPRAANVIAAADCECLTMSSKDFSSLLGSIVDKMNDLNNFRILRASPVFHSLSDKHLHFIKTMLVNHSMFKGQRIMCDASNLFIVMDGQIEDSKSKIHKSGGVLGDLIRGADDVAGSLTCRSEEGLVALVPRSAILDHIREQEKEKEEETAAGAVAQVSGPTPASSMSEQDSDQKAKIELLATERRREETSRARELLVADRKCSSLSELEVIKALGSGTFGSVVLARHKDTGRLLALKCLDKDAIIKSSQVQYVKREIISLQKFCHPFVAEYYGVLLSPRKVFFMLEFISGGEVWSYLYKSPPGAIKGPFGGLPVKEATLYAATICLALEHIHGLGYAYRDLKPENLLISHNGYIKLVDFGFAKQVPFTNKSDAVQYRTFTLCGTPDYMAPEVVLTQGHDKGADYWAFGVLVYELLCGHTPFESTSQKRTFEKIVHSQKHLAFPSSFDPHCKSLIRRLMHPNGALRLGALQHGFEDIYTHAVFVTQNVNFDALLRMELPMGFIPPAYVPQDPPARAADATPAAIVEVQEEEQVEEEEEEEEEGASEERKQEKAAATAAKVTARAEAAAAKAEAAAAASKAEAAAVLAANGGEMPIELINLEMELLYEESPDVVAAFEGFDELFGSGTSAASASASADEAASESSHESKGGDR